MHKAQAVGLFLLIAASPIYGEVIEGGGYSFSISAPAGWVMDKGVASDEADAVLYPQGTTYQNAPSVLYVNVAIKGDGFKDLKDLQRQDQESSRQQNPHLNLQKGPSLQTLSKRSLPLTLYLGLKNGGGEAVVYAEEEDIIVVFTLSSSNEQILHEDLPALQALVGSYEFIGKSGEELE